MPVSRAILASRMVAFEDLGMEAVRGFEVRNMPVTAQSTAAANQSTGSGRNVGNAHRCPRDAEPRVAIEIPHGLGVLARIMEGVGGRG